MFTRKITRNILEALSDTPVVFLRGARQTGKSTLVQAISKDLHPANYLTLDNAGILAAASADPIGFIAGLKKPVILDEAQRLESLFLAIKEDVDRHREPGRYLLTGSADVLALPRVASALAGRMEIQTLWPLCMPEISGIGENIIDTVFSKTFSLEGPPTDRTALAGAITKGGFPEPFQRTSPKRRQAWFESYLLTLMDRDIRSLAQIQDLTSVPRLLKLLAARTASLHNQSELSRTSGIPNSTLARYMALLKTLFLIQELPAWSTNLGKRLVKAPKYYMVDTGLACHLLDATDDKHVLSQGDLSGRLFENFVVLELFKHAAWAKRRSGLYHFRSQSGEEVDVVLESGNNIVGLEIKLSATPTAGDFAGLKLLKEKLGEKFLRGLLLYTGRDLVPFGDNLHAVPLGYLLPHFESIP